MKKLIQLIVISYVSFSFSQTNWIPLGTNIDGDGIALRAGLDLSLSKDGTTLAVGSPMNSPGKVRVYKFISGNWTQIGSDLAGINNDDFFGGSISLSNDGSIVAIGSKLGMHRGIQTGNAKVYINISGTWTQLGNTLSGGSSGDWFGVSVSLNDTGNMLAVGAIENDVNATDSGQVIIYELVSDSWVQIGSTINGQNSYEELGLDLHLIGNGNIVAIGSQNSYNYAGHVSVYENVSGNWTQIGQDIVGVNSDISSGRRFALNNSGDIIAIGAYHNNEFGSASGEVKVYKNVSGSWMQLGNDLNSYTAGDRFGIGVSLNDNGNILAVGAYHSGTGASRGGEVFIYKLSTTDQWVQYGSSLINYSSNAYFGFDVELNGLGNKLAVSAHGFNNFVGRVSVFENTSILSVMETDFSNAISFYPNPTYSTVDIDLGKKHQNISLDIYDVMGKLVFNTSYSNNNAITLNTEHLKSGIYLVKLKSENSHAVLKLVIK